MQVPPVAPRRPKPMSTWPNGSRHRPTKPGDAGSTPAVDTRTARRSSVDQSTALRRRVSHVRLVPARPAPQFSPGKRSGRIRSRPGTDEVVGPLGVERPASAESARSLSEYGSQPGVRVRPLPPGSDPAGSGACLENRYGSSRPLGVRVAPLPPHTRRDRQADKTPGPQPGGRGSTPRRGTQSRQQMPGGPVARTSGCYPEDGSSTLSLAATARWPRIQARGCRPRHGGESPSRASTHPFVVVVQRTRIPAGHAGDEGSTPSDHTLGTRTITPARS